MNSNNNCVLAYDFGGTYIRISVILNKKILGLEIYNWPLQLKPIEELYYFLDIGKEIAKKYKVLDKLNAIGISLGANIDCNGDIIKWPNRSSWEGMHFKLLVNKYLNLPVIIDDDVNLAALAEIKYGSAKGFNNVLVISVGTGIGAGIVLDGKPYKGKESWAGEVGHFIVVPDGINCACGRNGCLQSTASGQYLENIAKENGRKNVKELLNASKNGEEWANEALRTSGFWIGLTAANIVNLLNLECTIITGKLCCEDSPWWTALKDAFYANIRYFEKSEICLLKSRFNRCGSLLGATINAFDVLGANDIDSELINSFIRSFEN